MCSHKTITAHALAYQFPSEYPRDMDTSTPALEELFLEAQAPPRVTDPTRGAAGRAAHIANALYEPPKYDPSHAIKKVRYSHDAMIDMIIEQPAVSQNSLAAVFGYTPSWVSQVMSSDAFRARLEARKDELVDPQLRLTLNEKFNALVTRSLDIIQSKMVHDSCDPEIAFRAMELGAKALGLGGNRTQVINIPSPDRLDRLAERLKGLMQPQQGNVYDVQAIEVSPAA